MQDRACVIRVIDRTGCALMIAPSFHGMTSSPGRRPTTVLPGQMRERPRPVRPVRSVCGAEGATAPETLRQKDRIGLDTLESRQA